MPCPYGIDIPGIFLHYNKWKVENMLPEDKGAEDYRRNRRNYLISLDRSIPRDRQPDHCIQCGRCIHQKHCPQKINIPKELERVAQLVEQLKRDNT
jgi:predicted aldo/keto reductase-like oxidoreductase